MTQPRATYEAVSAAIEQLKLDNRSVTLAAIQAITGGSNSTIARYKRQYEAERPTILAARAINLNPEITHLIITEITRTAHEAVRDTGQRLAELENDMTRVSEEAERTAVTLELREAELEIAKGQIQALSGQIEQLRTDADAVKAAAAEQITLTEDRARIAIGKAEDEAQRERKGREGTIAELGQALARLEAIPRMTEEIARLQAALDAERTQRTDAERDVAVADAKAESWAARLADLQKQYQQLQDRENETHTALQRATDHLSAKADEAIKAAARIGALEGTVMALEKQLSETQ